MIVFLDFVEPVKYVFETLLNVHHFCLTVPSNSVCVCVCARALASGLDYYRKKSDVRLPMISHLFAFVIRYFFFQHCLYMVLPKNTDTCVHYVEAYKFVISVVTV